MHANCGNAAHPELLIQNTCAPGPLELHMPGWRSMRTRSTGPRLGGRMRDQPHRIEVRQGRVHLRLSASQIEVFAGSLDGTRDGCERKWAWRYVALVEDPPGPGAVLGKAVADQARGYWGWSFDFTIEGGYARRGRACSTCRSPARRGWCSRGSFTSLARAGTLTWGTRTSKWRTSPGVLGLVLDHKTTSDFRWQKTEDDSRSESPSHSLCR